MEMDIRLYISDRIAVDCGTIRATSILKGMPLLTENGRTFDMKLTFKAFIRI